jgi:hypothetical protein
MEEASNESVYAEDTAKIYYYAKTSGNLVLFMNLY